jgi:pimeloyl-ACP methyl ester carboxylesterase
MGHSLGAKIATRIAGAFRFELKALVLIDSGPKEETGYYESLRLSMLEGCQTYASREDYVAWLLRTRPFASEKTLARIADRALEVTSAGYAPRLDPRVVDILTTETNDDWWWDALRMIECPVLIVRGRASGILFKVIAQRMLACLRNGRLEIVPGSGHGVMTDNPSGFLAVVTRFMHEIETHR